MRRRFGETPGFGLRQSVTAILIVLNCLLMILLFDRGFARRPVGLVIRTTKPSTILADPQDELLIITVQRPKGRTSAANKPELLLNSKPVSWGDLRDALRAELQRRAP